MKQKVFVLNPHDSINVRELQVLLDEEWKVKFVNEEHVACSTNQQFDPIEIRGAIIYILER